MEKIFISYARKDGKELAEHLYERLTDCGYIVWKDSRDLYIGDEFPSAISKALEEADKVILLLSPSALQSNWVNAEIDMAMVAQHKILPVVFRGVGNKSIPLKIRKINYIIMNDINDWEALSRLVDGLKNGKKIPRIYSMSKPIDTKYESVLLLKRSELASEMPKTNKEIEKVAKAMWRDFLLFSKKLSNTNNVGFIPPGYAPLAAAVTALFAGRPNQLPRLYYPYQGLDGKFRIGAAKFIELQQLRMFAQSK